MTPIISTASKSFSVQTVRSAVWANRRKSGFKLQGLRVGLSEEEGQAKQRGLRMRKEAVRWCGLKSEHVQRPWG